MGMSSSSLTSNSRSRLRSTMLEFASKPPPRKHGGTDSRLSLGGGPQLDPFQSLDRAESQHSSDVAPAYTSWSKKKPPLHARGGMIQFLIIGQGRSRTPAGQLRNARRHRELPALSLDVIDVPAFAGHEPRPTLRDSTGAHSSTRHSSYPALTVSPRRDSLRRLQVKVSTHCDRDDSSPDIGREADDAD